jgi:hypothetical protein
MRETGIEGSMDKQVQQAGILVPTTLMLASVTLPALSWGLLSYYTFRILLANG